MIEEFQDLVSQYLSWLKDNTVLKEVSDWIEITTPFLDRHNDYLQIYAKRSNGGFLLSDGGFIVEDLEHSGCSLESPKRQDLLAMTLNGFGVQMEKRDKSLQVHTSAENFALRKHSLIQAMLAVNDLFFLAVPMITSLFLEDVVSWLELNDIRYTPKVKFTGKTGYDHLFDFVIPKSRKQPERIVQTINRPSRDTAQSVAFSWIDTREVRPPDSKAYAFLNDSDHPISSSVEEALRNYGVKPVLWSQVETVREELAA